MHINSIARHRYWPVIVIAGLVVLLLVTVVTVVLNDLNYRTTIAMVITSTVLMVLVAYLISHRSYLIDSATQAQYNDPHQVLIHLLGTLIEDPHATQPFAELLISIQNRFGMSHLAIYIIDEQSGKLCLLATSNKTAAAAISNQMTLNVLDDIHHSNKKVVNISLQVTAESYTVVGLYDEQQLYGFLAIDRILHHHSEHQFFITLTSYLASLICCTRRAQIKQRQNLYQERAIIARELHDSLAQSLTYLKIQATRLQSQIDKNKQTDNTDYSNLDDTISELRANLNLAYSQLRELMTTFRLTLNGQHLANVISDAIREFEHRSTISIDSDIRLSGNELSAQEELQLLQIVRESLSNIVRHSHATRATISLYMDKEQVQLKVSDDGVGIASIPDRTQHHGLIIMQERAQRLGADLHVDTSSTTGTRLQITFTPSGVGEVSKDNGRLQ